MSTTDDSNSVHRSARIVVWSLGIAIVVRFVSLGLYPLSDTTESRYAEIARKMLELGDWVTLWFDYGIPFWAKPPLSTWMTAASMRVFGVNEWAARLPHFLAGMLVSWLVWDWIRKYDQNIALLTVALLWGSGLYFVSAGTVMTDMALLVGITLAMRGFWVALHPVDTRSVFAPWLFFMGLAVGLLAKGPIAVILVGLPLGIWTLISGKLLEVWRGLPWVKGILLVAALVAPWYWLAELKTPGFLDYFLLGEHWHRFTVRGWSGDRYGNAHTRPLGMIWLNLLLACLPWAILVPLLARGRQQQVMPPSFGSDLSWRNYLIVWSLAPCIFFTVAHNILWTYVLPCLPPLAILTATWLARDRREARTHKCVAAGLILTTGLTVALAGGALLKGKFKSAKAVVAAIESQQIQNDQVLFVGQYQFSAAFYTRGHAQRLDTLEKLETHLHEEEASSVESKTCLVAVSSELTKKLSPQLKNRLKPEGQFESYRLYSVRR